MKLACFDGAARGFWKPRKRRLHTALFVSIVNGVRYYTRTPKERA